MSQPHDHEMKCYGSSPRYTKHDNVQVQHLYSTNLRLAKTLVEDCCNDKGSQGQKNDHLINSKLKPLSLMASLQRASEHHSAIASKKKSHETVKRKQDVAS
jgi:hypothetical protein